MNIKLFADGADAATIEVLRPDHNIKGWTTNPTLMRKAGVKNYKEFAKYFLALEKERPISFEVFADDFDEMERQAREIATWGPNVYVKIPITNTKRKYSYDLIQSLSRDGIKVNVTAVMTSQQVKYSTWALSLNTPAYISIFAGRIADTGVDPLPLMRDAVNYLRTSPNIELIWASPRELLNVFQAESVGCHIITATSDILKKLSLVGKDLDEYSLETVRMFYDDAQKAGFTL